MDTWRFQPFKVRWALTCCCGGVHSPPLASHFGFCLWGFAPSATRAFVVLGDRARLNLTIPASYSQIGWFCISAANIHCQHGGSVSFMWQEVSVLATRPTEQMLTEYVNHCWVKTLASMLHLYISLGPVFSCHNSGLKYGHSWKWSWGHSRNIWSAHRVAPWSLTRTPPSLPRSRTPAFVSRHRLTTVVCPAGLYKLEHFCCATNSHISIFLTVFFVLSTFSQRANNFFIGRQST